MKQFLTTKWISLATIILIFLFWLVAIYWSSAPARFNVRAAASSAAAAKNEKVVVGYTTSNTLIKVTESLLNKNGGYLSNDIIIPSVLMDDMPAWEFGVLEMVRDLALAMRKDFSRSQSQSLENPQLVKAQPDLNMNHRKWILPSAESM
jgi:hypothetical protein